MDPPMGMECHWVRLRYGLGLSQYPATKGALGGRSVVIWEDKTQRFFGVGDCYVMWGLMFLKAMWIMCIFIRLWIYVYLCTQILLHIQDNPTYPPHKDSGFLPVEGVSAVNCQQLAQVPVEMAPAHDLMVSDSVSRAGHSDELIFLMTRGSATERAMVKTKHKP